MAKALHPSGDMSSIPGLRTKIPHVTWKPKTKQKTDTNKCWQGCGKIESLRHYCGHVCVPVKLLSHIQLCDHMDCQAPLSMEFSKQEYWSGLPFLSPGDLPDSGIKPWSPTLQSDSLPSHLSHQGGPSWPLTWTQTSCTRIT